jgi:hypothetical protein
VWHLFCYSVGKEGVSESDNILKGADAHKQEDKEMKCQNRYPKDLPRGLPNAVRLLRSWVLEEDAAQKSAKFLAGVPVSGK